MHQDLTDLLACRVFREPQVGQDLKDHRVRLGLQGPAVLQDQQVLSVSPDQ